MAVPCAEGESSNPYAVGIDVASGKFDVAAEGDTLKTKSPTSLGLSPKMAGAVGCAILHGGSARTVSRWPPSARRRHDVSVENPADQALGQAERAEQDG